MSKVRFSLKKDCDNWWVLFATIPFVPKRIVGMFPRYREAVTCRKAVKQLLTKGKS